MTKSLSDEHTRSYFDAVTEGQYTSPAKHKQSGFLDFLEQLDGSRLVLDIGCGKGDFLRLVGQRCPESQLVGLDVSRRMLLHGLETGALVCASIHQPCFKAESLDIVHLDAVLHHLLGPTRKSSCQCAVRALENCVWLLKPGGYLLLAEPVYEPDLAGAVIFWLKKFIYIVSGGRRIRGLGAPVVSFYSRSMLLKQVQRMLSVHSCRFDPWATSWPMNMLMRRRGRMLIVAQKCPSVHNRSEK